MPLSAAESGVVDAFVRAYQASDVDAVIALLTNDVFISMPPMPFEYEGLEAAAGWGIDLDRLVWVADPGDRWMSTVGSMADVLGLVIVRAPARITSAEASRLLARLRQTRSTMLVLGEWPQSESQIRVVSSTWTGLGDGYGHLADRHLELEVRQGQSAGPPRRSRLRVPAEMMP
jgi:hypothetical protein